MLRLVARKWRLDNERAAIDWPSGTKRVFRRKHRSSMILQPQGGATSVGAMAISLCMR